jgi:TonB-dependent starch-binding outer membrane protein SusC
LTFQLTQVQNSMDEVVVIGYGSKKKRDLTGSVTSVQGSVLAMAPVTSVGEALTGRLTGVQITTADGSPDAELLVRVRGGTSITGDNTPLYIVDGFPVGSLNAISPQDIQTIDVLKDASSTAIYGSRGANGVVIITTKSAKSGKTQISYNAFMQTKKLEKRLAVLDPYQYVRLNYELAALNGTTGIAGFNSQFGVYGDMDLYKFQTGHDWQNDMFGSNVV